jgi:hypothetical protein
MSLFMLWKSTPTLLKAPQHGSVDTPFSYSSWSSTGNTVNNLGMAFKGDKSLPEATPWCGHTYCL